MSDCPDPSWIATLRAAVDRSSIRQVARQIDLSPTAISQVLSGKYRARTDGIAARVRDHLMAQDVDCPVLGRITTARCDVEQREPFSTANPVAICRYRACRSGCPRFRGMPAPRGGAR